MGNKEQILSIIIPLTWIDIEYPEASFPRCEYGTSAAPVWLQGASPQVLLCQSSHEKLAVQRGTYHEKPRKMKEWQGVLQSKSAAVGMQMVSCYLPDHGHAVPSLPAGKRSNKWGTPEWCFPCEALQMGLLSSFLSSLLTFLTLTMCTAWGAFGTHR